MNNMLLCLEAIEFKCHYHKDNTLSILTMSFEDVIMQVFNGIDLINLKLLDEFYE